MAEQIPMQVVVLDGCELEKSTAANLTKLAGLRGLQDVTVVWDDEKKQYIANGTPCGRSVHGVMEWMAKEGAHV